MRILHYVLVLSLALTAAAEARNTPIRISALGNTIIEAEDYNKRNMRKQHKWEKVRGKREGIPTHMHALPADNTVFDINHKSFEKRTPILEYKVDFAERGTYYLWIHGKGEPGGANLAVGLDDQLLRAADVGFFPYSFSWRGTYRDGSRIRLNITETGEHLLQIWMIEDGMRVDKYMLTTDGQFKP